MIMVKATKDSEAGILPSKQLLTEMDKFNEELVKSGVMLAGEGLQASSKGARVKFSGNTRTVIDGPFAETKELIAGYWIWKVQSKEEAIEWVKRCPNPFPGKESEIEIRQVFEAEDFGTEFTPELREQEARQVTKGGMKNIQRTDYGEGVHLHAKNYAVFVVRQQRRRSGEVLCVDIQEFQGRTCYPLWRSRGEGFGKAQGISDDCDV
jgi:hypothetical protein